MIAHGSRIPDQGTHPSRTRHLRIQHPGAKEACAKDIPGRGRGCLEDDGLPSDSPLVARRAKWGALAKDGDAAFPERILKKRLAAVVLLYRPLKLLLHLARGLLLGRGSFVHIAD